MSTKTKPRHDFDLDQIVTDKLLAEMQAGVGPWQAPYLTNGLPMSMSTGRAYRGINFILLAITAAERGYASRWYGTYEQIQKRGGQVKSKPEGFIGDWGTLVVFWSRWERKVKDENGKPVIGPDGKPEVKRGAVLRYFKVFNAEQCEWPNGMPTKFEATEHGDDFDPVEAADLIALGYTSNGGPIIQHADQTMAWYAPSSDVVNVPNPENIAGSDEYYSALFHELTHSTGHRDRLARDGIIERHGRGKVYAFEELVAEFGAAILCAHSGIHDTVDNSAAYLRGWVRFLTDDPKAAVRAATKAQAAVDLILRTEFDNDNDDTEES
jgi:antirestriction protein ArdC